MNIINLSYGNSVEMKPLDALPQGLVQEGHPFEDESYVMRRSTDRFGNNPISSVGDLLGCHMAQEVTEKA